MNIAEAHRLKAVEAEVATLKRLVDDLLRQRYEPKAEKDDNTLRLKKSG